MKLSELIAAYGDDKVAIQNMDQCAGSIDWSAKKGTKATVHTDEPVDMNGFQRLGLILWLDRDRVKEILSLDRDPKSNEVGE